MKIRLPKALAVGAVAAAMLATSGCGGILGGDGDTTADSGPIKIAAVIPLSGSSAPTGVYMKNGMQMAVDEINAKGGVLGRQLSLDLEDGACDPTQAAAAANKAVSNGAVISVGGYCSGATLPTLPIFAKANIPMIIPAANSQELVNQKLPSVFMINGTGTQQAAAAVKFMTKDGVKSVALVDDNTSYSKDIATETKKDLEADGGVKVALATSVTAGESDYSSAVHDIMGANPDMLYWTGYYQEGGLIINQLKAAGYTGAYCQVTAFIRAWREVDGKTPRAFVPLIFEQGEAFQFDWSEEGLVIGGIYRRLQVSHTKLCAAGYSSSARSKSDSRKRTIGFSCASQTCLALPPIRSVVAISRRWSMPFRLDSLRNLSTSCLVM